MGRRGPQPKPTHLKIVQGNPGKRKLPEWEPQPKPIRPKKLGRNESVERIYAELERITESMGVLTEADGVALQVAADAIAEYFQAVKVANRKGAEWRDKIRVRDARTQVLACIREFGLSPSSRPRIKVSGGKTDDFEEFLNRGTQI